jgi:hypothetical protein
MKKVKYSSRVFSDPFAADPDYYKNKSYDDVFKAVKEEINNNFYTWTKSAEYIRLKSDFDLTSTLKAVVPWCPDLFESDSPDARKLVAHFGELIQISYYGQSHRERQKAKKAIDDILNNPHPHAKWGKVRIPPFLSRNDLCAYLHQITKYLREQHINCYGNDIPPKMTAEILNVLKETDKRLLEIVKKRYLKVLLKKPKELTIKLVADFLGLTTNGLRQQLKEEKRHPNTCQLNW